MNNQTPPPVAEQPNPHTRYLLRQAELKYEMAWMLDNMPWLTFGWFIFIPIFTIPVVMILSACGIGAYFLRKSAWALAEYTGVDAKKWQRPIIIRNTIASLIVKGIVLWGAWQTGEQFMVHFLKWLYAG